MERRLPIELAFIKFTVHLNPSFISYIHVHTSDCAKYNAIHTLGLDLVKIQITYMLVEKLSTNIPYQGATIILFTFAHAHILVGKRHRDVHSIMLYSHTWANILRI